MTQQYSVIRLTDAAPEQLAQVLSRAFFPEPNVTYILPDEQVRQAALPWFFGFVVRLGLRFGEVYLAEPTAGGAIWLSPGKTVTFGGALRAGMLAMPFKFGWGGFGRSLRLTRTIETARKQSVPRQHWYLMALGVEPSKQGQGLGGALMQPVLARADGAGLPCYLETFNDRNVPFYAKHGFTVVISGHIAHGGPHFWGMMREPGT